MAVLFPNRTGSFATYKTGTPNYIDLSSETAAAGLTAISAKAAAESWADGDTFGVLVRKSDSAWAVWTGSWDATNSYVECVSSEDSVGTLSNNDSVSVIICPTETTLSAILYAPPSTLIATESGTTRSITDADAGKLVRFTSSSAVTVTPATGIVSGFHCVLAQSGTGLVSVIAGSGDTINAVTTAIAMGGQFTTGYLVKTGSTTWDFYA